MLSPAAQERMMLRQAAAAFPKADAGELVIALSHHPEFFPVAAARGAQLTLSSHTHGGQVKAFGYPLFGAYDYMSGLYEMNRKHLDVSAGFGHWVPLRFNVPREIVIVTLRRTARDVRSKPNPAPVSVFGVRARRVHASSALAQAQQAT